MFRPAACSQTETPAFQGNSPRYLSLPQSSSKSSVSFPREKEHSLLGDSRHQLKVRSVYSAATFSINIFFSVSVFFVRKASLSSEESGRRQNNFLQSEFPSPVDDIERFILSIPRRLVFLQRFRPATLENGRFFYENVHLLCAFTGQFSGTGNRPCWPLSASSAGKRRFRVSMHFHGDNVVSKPLPQSVSLPDPSEASRTTEYSGSKSRHRELPCSPSNSPYLL